jgi:hypothetical protein
VPAILPANDSACFPNFRLVDTPMAFDLSAPDSALDCCCERSLRSFKEVDELYEGEDDIYYDNEEEAFEAKGWSSWRTTDIIDASQNVLSTSPTCSALWTSSLRPLPFESLGNIRPKSSDCLRTFRTIILPYTIIGCTSGKERLCHSNCSAHTLPNPRKDAVGQELEQLGHNTFNLVLGPCIAELLLES